MTDEKFCFVSDVRDKKRTARGAFNKRTHTGKSGGMKTAYDYMNKKEREAMNGELKSYKLNEPMEWKEFKAMPDDIKDAYLQALKQRYNVSTVKLGEMFGVNQKTVSTEMMRLGIAQGRYAKRGHFDKEGWAKFSGEITGSAPLNNAPIAADEETQEETQEETAHENFGYLSLNIPEIPESGRLNFSGNADCILNTVANILRGANVKINVSWEAVTEVNNAV